MTQNFPVFSARILVVIGLAVFLLLSAPPLAAQQTATGQSDLILPANFEPGFAPGGDDHVAAPVRNDRIRLFRIQPGFIADPVGIQEDDEFPGNGNTEKPGPASADDGPDWLQVAAGSDLPYFELRHRGDPGGLGFYRVYTQVQLFDTGTSSATLGLQAVTPSGIQFGGLQDGPTVFSPSFGIFQSLGASTALQGFLGKNLPVANAAGAPFLQHNMQCGLALQRSMAPGAANGLENVYLSVGALGQYHALRDASRPNSLLEVLPGMHWRLNDNWWMSGSVAVPTRSSHLETGQWQFTCSFRF